MIKTGLNRLEEPYRRENIHRKKEGGLAGGHRQRIARTAAIVSSRSGRLRRVFPLREMTNREAQYQCNNRKWTFHLFLLPTGRLPSDIGAAESPSAPEHGRLCTSLLMDFLNYGAVQNASGMFDTCARFVRTFKWIITFANLGKSGKSSTAEGYPDGE